MPNIVLDDPPTPLVSTNLVNGNNGTLSNLLRTVGNGNVNNIFQQDSEGNGPFVVVCRTIPSEIYPMFSNFTLIHLKMKGGVAIPPWNATVFIVLDMKDKNNCNNHPYYLEAFERRKNSPLLVTLNVQTSNATGEWYEGVHWPKFSSQSDPSKSAYLRGIKDRPAIVRVRGEVFWRDMYGSCSDVDFVLYREKEVPAIDCLNIHFVQGVALSTARKDEEYGMENVTDIYEKKVAHPNKPVDDVHYDNFCSLVIRFDSSKPGGMFKTTNYDIDAIVRHMFFRQLSEYKPCQRVKECPGTYGVSFKCMVGYKFHITMDNSLVDGYVSEKVFNGALGGGIPIYFGATDVGSYVNIKSIIHCDVSREVIEEMRSFYPRVSIKPRPFTFKRASNGTYPTDEELLNWADGYLRSHLEPCVKRVIELDTNDTAFREVLDEPFITDHGIMSGEYPLRGVASAYNLLRKWEGSGGAIAKSSFVQED
eukprot:g7109.t1 g7109   contig23:1889206-1890636(-)